MEDRDWIFPCYREHGAALLRGMPLAAFLCDLLGNAGDRMKGHQMPCHEAWRPGRYASVSSPIARALIGKEAGEVVEVRVPDGVRHYEIVDVRYV